MKKGDMSAVFKILIAGFGWGIIGVFSRPLSAAGLSAVQITCVRSVIVAVGMAVILFVKDRSLLRIQLKDLWMFLGTGLLSIVFFNICYFLTIERATLAAASILLYTAPCFVLLMSAIFFREKITAQKTIALILAFAGCALVSGFSGGGMSLFALMTGISSGFGYALYSIFGTLALKKYQPFTVTFYTFLVASAVMLPMSGVGVIMQVLTEDLYVLGNGLALGLISTLLPFIFYTAGLKQMEAGKASVLAFAEPLVAAIAGIMIFKEKLNTQNGAGIGLIFLAILLLNIQINMGRQRQ
ncbi:MAG: EamA family transporter [Schaedlerella sp.]|nr:DMT family transporter [Lachnospiraceae bacterium]MDY4202971.1 EamA family transporter [Schaedlerella sp.]